MSGATTPSLPADRAAGAPAAPAALVVWACLAIVYVVWGSTYLAIRVMVETMPPLLGAGLRFMVAGALLVAFLALRGRAVPSRRELAGAAVIGTLLTGGNALVSVGEVDVPSALAALLIAAVPLVVILLRLLSGDDVARTSLTGVLVGFVGVGILLLPGERPDGATLIGMLACLAGAVLWATGSFASPRTALPREPFVSTGWQMLIGGAFWILVGLIAGEAGDVEPSAFSTRSIAAWLYLVLIGSIVAYTAYIWLLQNVPVSKVATYAYVNPVIAILLGWLILSETITTTTIAGAAIIVASVAAVVRVESRRPARAAATDSAS